MRIGPIHTKVLIYLKKQQTKNSINEVFNLIFFFQNKKREKKEKNEFKNK